MAELINPNKLSNIVVEEYDNEYSIYFTDGKYKSYGVVSSNTLPNTLRFLADHIEYKNQL